MGSLLVPRHGPADGPHGEGRSHHPPPRQRQAPSVCPTAIRSRRCASLLGRVPAGRGAGPAALPGRRGGLPGLRHGAAHGAVAAHDRATTSGCPTRCSCSPIRCWSSTTCATGCWSSPTPTWTSATPPSLDRAYDAAAVRIGMTLAKLARPARAAAPPTLTAPGAAGRARRGRLHLDHGRGGSSRTPCGGPRSTSPPATPTRSCCRAGSTVELEADPFTVYRALRTINPSPYLFYPAPGQDDASSAPRPRCWCASRTIGWRSVRSPGRIPAARPRPQDAGDRRDDEARPQGAGRARHARGSRAQRRGPRRRARLRRGDRVHGMERYSHVMHLVSHVIGKLKAGCDAFDVLRAPASRPAR